MSKTFEDLGLHADICKVLVLRHWNEPTPIQADAIPHILKGRDIVGLAVTGSGKTGAFLLPILQSMISGKIHPFYAAVLTPTRELSLQIAEEARLLSGTFQIRLAVLVGGMNMTQQKKELAKEPHIVIGTPGRFADHLQTNKDFDLGLLKFLVIDEADRLLCQDFEADLYKVVNACNTKRQTLLFSATMTSKVTKLQRASLNKPVKVQVDDKRQVAPNLDQYIAFVSEQYKPAYVAVLIKRWKDSRVIIFSNTCKTARMLVAFFKRLNIMAVGLSGDMNQTSRIASLNQFRKNNKKVLVTTDVASRGLDIPEVELVVNYDVPTHHKTYIHRVGRTARAGTKGTCFTLVTKRDALFYKKLELKIFGDEESAWPKVFQDIKKDEYQLEELSEVRQVAEAECAATAATTKKRRRSAPP